MTADIPDAVRKAMRRGKPIELDWGVVLRPPSDPASVGAAGSYRWDYYDPPVRADGTRGERAQKSARSLETAWRRVNRLVAQLEATMVAQETGHRLEATFGQLLDHYLDPKRHPDWGTSQASKVASVAKNWLIADDITVEVPADSPYARPRATPLRDVPLRKISAGLLTEALSHVLLRRAYGTYRTAYEVVTGTVGWAGTQKWAPAGWIDLHDLKRAPDPRVAGRKQGSRNRVKPVPKDDIGDTGDLNAFAAHVQRVSGFADRVLMDLLAYAGPRIGEALALGAGAWSRDEERNGWFEVLERTQKASAGTALPKHHKLRDVWVPAWLADDIDRLEPRGPHQLFWPAPQGGYWPVDRWRSRRFDRWAESMLLPSGEQWPELDDYCPHTANGHTAKTCRKGGQDRRRWRWATHAWRHHAAVFQMFDLLIDAEDVAQHLGHSDGYSCYQMYVGARPRPRQRLAKAAARAGDPRSGSPSA